MCTRYYGNDEVWSFSASTIAAISFLGDYLKRPEEGFLIFMSNPDEELIFTPYHHPDAVNGHWIARDVLDWNGDCFDDILHSNYSIGPDITPEQRKIDDVFKAGLICP